MTKSEKIQNFDPSQPGLADGNLFGLPFTIDESEIVIIAVPWEVTVSYGSGASEGPEAILEASYQVDLLHQEYPNLWKQGIFLDETPSHWLTNSEVYKTKAQTIIEALENGISIENDPYLTQLLAEINAACLDLHTEVEQKVTHWLSKGKKVVLLGGDHSTPLGYYKALAKKYSSFGILHIDAHMDLRIGYEGFTYSHASIMYNALQLPEVSKIVQVGIRDFSEEEVGVIQNNSSKIKVFTDSDLKKHQFEGKTWQQQCDEIITQLPENVCISFDIDGLSPLFCPNTGTPVPGGLQYEQATYLLSKVAESNKKIIGFDLVEVAPSPTQTDDWDGNVGARLLFHLCGVLAKSTGLEVGKPLEF